MSNDIQPSPPQPEFLPEIRRGRLDKLTIHEISDSELEALEQGAPNSIYLNFAVFLLSSASSFTITLLTTKIESGRVYTFFAIFTVIGYIVGVLLLLLWWKEYKSASKVADAIRKRLPPEGEVAPLPPVKDSN